VKTVENDGPRRYKNFTIFYENPTNVSKYEWNKNLGTCRKHDNATSLLVFCVGRKGG
jgi:hypothetical protein